MSAAGWICLVLAWLSASVALGMLIGRMIRSKTHDPDDDQEESQ